MSPTMPWIRRAASACCLVLLLFALFASAGAQPRTPQPPPLPFSPDWALLAGWDVYAKKGCGQCHGVRSGSEGRAAPDLARIQSGTGFYELGAAMWNHLPLMGAKMREKGIERPTLTPLEVSNVLAFIFTAQYNDELGNAKTGEQLFMTKGCVQCHAIGGKGGKVGPELGRAHHVSLTQFAGLMWNHGPAMWARMKERGIEVPQLNGQEMADIVAYLYTAHYFDPAAGSAARGQQVVQTRGCVACHSVRGKGGKVAADFATSNVVGSPAVLVAAMWNHSRSMEDQATKQGLKLPTLKGQELADIAAYFRSFTKAAPTPQK